MSTGSLLQPMPSWALALCGALLVFSLVAPVGRIRQLIGIIRWRTEASGNAVACKPAKNMVSGLFLRQVAAALGLLALGAALATGRGVPIVAGGVFGLLALSVSRRLLAARKAAKEMIEP